MDFVVKFGFLGWLMGNFMMKPMMKRITKDVMKGLAYYVVTGNTVGSKLPSDADLAPALA